MRLTLADRIDAVLNGKSVSFDKLALALWPDAKSHRYSANGGPPGCYMALSRALRRYGFPQSWPSVGTGNRIVMPRN